MYLLKRDYDRAIDYFRELQQRFPHGTRASYAHWKAAWLTFRKAGPMRRARISKSKSHSIRIRRNSQCAVLARALPKRKAIPPWRGVLSEAFRSLPQLLLRGVGRQRLNNLRPRSGSPMPTRRTMPCSIEFSAAHTGKLRPPNHPRQPARRTGAFALQRRPVRFGVRELQAASQVDGTWRHRNSRVYQDGAATIAALKS